MKNYQEYEFHGWIDLKIIYKLSKTTVTSNRTLDHVKYQFTSCRVDYIAWNPMLSFYRSWRLRLRTVLVVSRPLKLSASSSCRMTTMLVPRSKRNWMNWHANEKDWTSKCNQDLDTLFPKFVGIYLKRDCCIWCSLFVKLFSYKHSFLLSVGYHTVTNVNCWLLCLILLWNKMKKPITNIFF